MKQYLLGKQSEGLLTAKAVAILRIPRRRSPVVPALHTGGAVLGVLRAMEGNDSGSVISGKPTPVHRASSSLGTLA